jgi:hypothetical protein
MFMQRVSKWLERWLSAIMVLKTHAEVSFPHGTRQQVIRFFCACAFPLPFFLSVCDVTQRLWRLRSRKRFVCCNLWIMNQLFLLNGHSGDNSTVISHIQIAGICSFRQRGALVLEKVQDGRMLMRVWQELDYRLDMCCVTRGGHNEHL